MSHKAIESAVMVLWSEIGPGHGLSPEDWAATAHEILNRHFGKLTSDVERLKEGNALLEKVCGSHVSRLNQKSREIERLTAIIQKNLDALPKDWTDEANCYTEPLPNEHTDTGAHEGVVMKAYKLEIYPRTRYGKRRWYWRLTAPNGRIVCVAGESFHSLANAKRAADRVWQIVAWGRVEDVTK